MSRYTESEVEKRVVPKGGEEGGAGGGIRTRGLSITNRAQ